MATTKETTVGEREPGVRELFLREPEIIAWLTSDDSNAGNDSTAMDASAETSQDGKEDA